MTIARRQFLQLAGAGLLAVAPQAFATEDYPTRPVRWIIGFYSYRSWLYASGSIRIPGSPGADCWRHFRRHTRTIAELVYDVRVGAQVVSVRVIGCIRQKRVIRVQRQPRGMVARPGVAKDADIPVIRSAGASAGRGLIQRRIQLDRPCRRIRDDVERAVLPEEVVGEDRVRELVAKHMARGAAGESGREYSAQEHGVGGRRQPSWL